MMIIALRRNIDKISGFPDMVLGDIYDKKWGGGEECLKLTLNNGIFQQLWPKTK